jgi:hypothetical protein
MKNKIINILTIIIPIIILFFLVLIYIDISDECYYGSTYDQQRLVKLTQSLVAFNFVLFVVQIIFYFKKKSNKTKIFLTIFNAISFFILMNFIQSFKYKMQRDFSEPTSTIMESIPLDTIQNEIITTQKNSIEYDSILCIENQNELIIYTKGQEYFQLIEMEEKSKDYYFPKNPSDKILILKGDRRYELIGTRYQHNETTTAPQNIFIDSKIDSNISIADFQIIFDYEGRFGIGLGLQKGFKAHFKNGKISITK